MNFKDIPEPPKEVNIYEKNGYENRKDYLDGLADEYGNDVYVLAELLGESEDFDGLVTSLEDIEAY